MMFRYSLAWLFFVLVSSALPVRAGEEVVAFVDVDVVPMDQDGVIERQTVLVRGQHIEAIGPVDQIVIPQGARRIAARGKTLLPGLIDMHQHIGNNADALTLYIANGVTSVREFNATPYTLELKKEVESGERLGPEIAQAGGMMVGLPPPYRWMVYTYQFSVVLIGGLLLVGIAFASVRLNTKLPWGRSIRGKFWPLVATVSVLAGVNTFLGVVPAGPVVELLAPDKLALSPASAQRLVRKHKADGYDFIKVQWFLEREVFDAMMQTAREEGLGVAGHVPADVGPRHFIAAGADPEHNYQLLALVAKDYVRQAGANPIDKFDLSQADAMIPGLVELMKGAKVNYEPTLVTYESISALFDNIDDMAATPLLQRPEYRLVPPEHLAHWTDPHNEEFELVMKARGASHISEIIPSSERRAEVMMVSKRIVKALYDAGVPIIAGSDSTDPGVVWGFSLHRELELLVEAGLSPYQALTAATSVAARVLGRADDLGTVAVGKRADLVLLDDNPLQDISRTRGIGGVMTRGRWLPRQELDQMLGAIEAKYHGAKRE